MWGFLQCNDDDDIDIIGLVQDLTGGSDLGFAAHPKEGELEINFHGEENDGGDDKDDDDHLESGGDDQGDKYIWKVPTLKRESSK